MQFPPEVVGAHPEHAEHGGTTEDKRTKSFYLNAGGMLQNASEAIKRDCRGNHVGPVL